MGPEVDERIDRLSAVSANRVIEPDQELAGAVGPGAVLPPDLLSVAGLGLALTDAQLARLSREEVAAFLDTAIRFEALNLAMFGFQINRAHRLAESWVVYALHEVGEETRHSRLFSRLLGQLGATARNPMDRALLHLGEQFGVVGTAG